MLVKELFIRNRKSNQIASINANANKQMDRWHVARILNAKGSETFLYDMK